METKVKYVCLFGDPNSGVVIGSINTNSVKVLGWWMHKFVSGDSAGTNEFRLWNEGSRHKVSVEQMRQIAFNEKLNKYSVGRIMRSIKKQNQ